MPPTRKVFMRIPPDDSPEEKQQLIEEFARRLQVELGKNPEVLKPRSPTAEKAAETENEGRWRDE